VLKIYLNYGEVLENILSQNAVNCLSYSIGDIGKIVHSQKHVIAPHRVPDFHRSLDPRRHCRPSLTLCWGSHHHPKPAPGPATAAYSGWYAIVVYGAAIPLSFVQPWIACACYVMVAVMWLLPDPRIEKAIGQ
jgi:hypothetical protein